MITNVHQGDRLRFGLVGAGRIAQTYIDAFAKTPNACLAGVTDVRREAADSVASRVGCPAFSSHLEMADSGKIDAVVVATPPSVHVPICLDLLERGIPVLCEKPVSFSVEAAQRICMEAKEKKALFTMASKFRYAEDVVRARNIVRSGILGEPVLFENTFMSYVDMASRWNAQPSISGGGVLIDNGTHSVDIMRYFIGPLESIHAVRGPSIQGLAVDETVYVTARAGGGAIGRMDLSWSFSKQSDDYIAIYGPSGTLRVGWKSSFYRQKGSSEWVQFGHGYDKLQAFCDQIGNFSSAIQGHEQLLIDGEDAIASVEVIQAGYESLAGNSWTSVGSATLAEQAVAA